MISKSELEDVISNSITMTEAFAKSKMRNFQSFRKYAKMHNLWMPNPGGKGVNKRTSSGYPLADILNGKYPGYPSSKLKRRLVKSGIFEDVCSECKITSIWNGKPLSLQLDHIDGDNKNNLKSNLRLLCPNCHSQTSTFGSKNI